MSAPATIANRHVVVLLRHDPAEQFVGVFESDAATKRHLATLGVEDTFAARSAAGYILYGAFVQS